MVVVPFVKLEFAAVANELPKLLAKAAWLANEESQPVKIDWNVVPPTVSTPHNESWTAHTL